MKQLISGAVAGAVVASAISLFGAGRAEHAPTSGEFVDKHGRVRIRINAEDNPSIQFLDESGRCVTLVGSDQSGPCCWVNDPESKRKIGFMSDHHDGSKLIITDDSGVRRVNLGCVSTFAWLKLTDENADPTISLESPQSKSSPSMFLSWPSKHKAWNAPMITLPDLKPKEVPGGNVN